MNRNLAIAVALPVLMALWVGTSVLNVPMYDEWIWSPLVLAAHQHTLTAADLWAPQGAHRSIVPTALALGLAAIDGWDIRIEALLGVAFAAVTQYALWQILRRRLGAQTAARPFLFASLLLYALTQCENWLWGFQLSWFLVDACAAGAIALLDGADRRVFRFAAAVVLAATASFSLIFGFAIWIAGALVLWMTGAARATLVWCAAAAITAAAFLIGYATPATEHGWIANAGSPLLDAPQFVLAYLGAPLGIFGGRWLCEALGIVLIVSAIALLRTGSANQRVRNAPLAGLVVFTVVAAMLEAIGRGGNGVDAALAFRYTTPSTLAWIALIGLIAADRPAVSCSLLRTAFAVAAALFVGANAAGAFEALQLLGAQRGAYEALRNPAAHDDEELALYVNDPAMLRVAAARLRGAALGPYRDPAFSSPAP